jgi:hypothetical protein
LDPHPRALRGSLRQLEDMLGDAEPQVRRSVRLIFGELIADLNRFGHAPPHRLVVDVEVPADSVRLRIAPTSNAFGGMNWPRLVNAATIDRVSAWGVDRRRPGGAWFVFETSR